MYSNPLRVLDTKNPAMQEMVNGAPRLLDFLGEGSLAHFDGLKAILDANGVPWTVNRSEEHTSELQSQSNLVCRLLLEKKNKACNNSTATLRSRLYLHPNLGRLRLSWTSCLSFASARSCHATA